MNKEQTVKIKGIALILMFWHHLFICFGWNAQWSPIFNETILYIVSRFGKICVAMFLFCSGYGLYKSYILSKKNSFKKYVIRFLKVLIPYWIIMLIAIIYLKIKNKFEVKYLFINMFALVNNDDILYVSFSWFIRLYLCILLIIPLIKYIENKFKKGIILDLILYIFIPILFYCLLNDYTSGGLYYGYKNIIKDSVTFTVSYCPVFFIGMLYSKYDVYIKIKHLIKNKNLNTIFILFLSFIVSVSVLFIRTISSPNIIPVVDTAITPFFITSLLLVSDNIKFHSNYIIPFIGKYSMEYWLLSGMFFLNTSELQFILYLPKYSILILLWKLILLAPFAFICHFISEKIIKLISKLMKI